MLTQRHRPFRRCGPMAVLAALASLAGCSFGPEQEPVFCYQTLADIGCYAQPDPGRAGQLVGVYLRDPQDPSAKEYWLRAAEARMSR